MPVGHPLGHRLGHPAGQPLGDTRLPVGKWPVAFLGHGNFASVTGTSVSVAKGTAMGLQVGDLVLLLQISISAPTTPTGYTQVLQVNTAQTQFSQILTVWSKTIATSGEGTTSVGIGQATSGALQGLFLGFRGALATPVVDVATGAANYQSGSPQAIPGGTAGAKGYALGLACPTTVSGTPTYTPSAGWTLMQPAVFGARLAGMVRPCIAGQALAGTIASSVIGAGLSNWDTALLTLK